MTDELQPIEPRNAVKMYLNERQPELAEKTVENITQHLGKFVEWCEENGIADTSQLTGRSLHEYRTWRQEGIAQTTLRINLSSVRKFIEWCEAVDAAPDGLADAMIIPSQHRNEEARDEMLPADRAEEMLQHLRTYQYASRTHALLELMWHTGIRKGTVRALGLDDFHPRKQTLEVHHRPPEPPLKNGRRGQRTIALIDGVTDVISSYIEVHRKDKTDENRREPLFTTRYGRLSKSGIKNATYTITRPCVYGSCPHNRNPEECEAADDNLASQCPSSVSPHPVRRGSITHHLLNDVPQTAVSGRCDVSKDILDHHYDRRSELEKVEQRREYLEGL